MAGAPGVVRADDQATFGCGWGTGLFYFGLPIEGAPRFHQFYYRYNREPTWRSTFWYYTFASGAYYYDTAAQRWISFGLYGNSMIWMDPGPNVYVEAWEYRVSTNGAREWRAFQPCTTWSVVGGITFGY